VVGVVGLPPVANRRTAVVRVVVPGTTAQELWLPAPFLLYKFLLRKMAANLAKFFVAVARCRHVLDAQTSFAGIGQRHDREFCLLFDRFAVGAGALYHVGGYNCALARGRAKRENQQNLLRNKFQTVGF
jgi:hypothetical protein